MSGAGQRLDPAERRLLAGMPLHAITSVHGETGLQERVLIEIAQFPTADHSRTRHALATASRLRAADRRQLPCGDLRCECGVSRDLPGCQLARADGRPGQLR